MDKNKLQAKKLVKLQEMKKLMAARNAKLREAKANRPGAGLAKLLEGELERAELTLNAQDVVNKLQDTAEDLAKMSVEQLMPLVDEMKGEFGPEAAQRFEQEVGGALDAALQTVRDAREQVNNAVLKMQGKLSDEDVTVPDNDMADDIGGGVGLDGPNDIEDEMDGEDDLGLEIDGDEFGGAPAASGEEDEPLGRVKKESADRSKKKSEELVESRYEADLVDAFVELTESDDVNSLTLEIVADKYSVCEEELFDLYNTAEELIKEAQKYRVHNTSAIREALNLKEKERVDEFLPMLGALAGAGARVAGGAALHGLGGLAKGAAKQLGKAALRKGAGMAMDKVGGMFGGDDEAGSTQGTMSPAEKAKQEQMKKKEIATDPDMRKLAAKFKVQPQDLEALAGVMGANESIANIKKALKEHRILDEIAGVHQDDAVRLIKERIKAVKTGKDLAVRETFPADVQLTTPRMVVKQLTAKYGDPEGWAVARSGEGSHYVLSSPIPETDKAKSLEGEITSLEEEITGIREKHKDVQVEYQLPQEIKVADLRKRLGEYQTGYRHQVAKWLTLDEASALITLAQAYAPKKKGK